MDGAGNGEIVYLWFRVGKQRNHVMQHGVKLLASAQEAPPEGRQVCAGQADSSLHLPSPAINTAGMSETIDIVLLSALIWRIDVLDVPEGQPKPGALLESKKWKCLQTNDRSGPTRARILMICLHLSCNRYPLLEQALLPTHNSQTPRPPFLQGSVDSPQQLHEGHALAEEVHLQLHDALRQLLAEQRQARCSGQLHGTLHPEIDFNLLPTECFEHGGLLRC